jgi:ABC-2 type transport system permease protein
MTATTLAARSLPPLGGFSPALVGMELKRTLRNKRTLIFTFIMPAVLFLAFGTNGPSRTTMIGDGNVTGYIAISMAVYGAMLATTSGGAMVSMERALGWSRQLRLTPLSAVSYVAVKLVVAMLLGALSVAVPMAVGALSGAKLPAEAWVLSPLLGWLCALVFAALGLFMGYLLPSENVMQILGPGLALLSFAGGLFVPLDQMGDVFGTVAKFSPAYGVGVIARYPLTHSGSLATAILNVTAWTAVFVLGAVWRFRRDTARV